MAVGLISYFEQIKVENRQNEYWPDSLQGIGKAKF
jgi:hypothetical protein